LGKGFGTGRIAKVESSEGKKVKEQVMGKRMRSGCGPTSVTSGSRDTTGWHDEKKLIKGERKKEEVSSTGFRENVAPP